MILCNVDPALYERTPRFGCAGGGLQLRLTVAGNLRVFAVATGFRVEEQELEMLTTIAAAGSSGWHAHSAATSILVGRGWIESKGARFVITRDGSNALARFYDEEAMLLARIESECAMRRPL